jgi:hypothetical protein
LYTFESYDITKTKSVTGTAIPISLSCCELIFCGIFEVLNQKNKSLMANTNNPTSPITQLSLGSRMLAGAVLGLLVIAFFLFSAGDPDPLWGKLWMVRPLIIVPVAGAMAGLCNYFIVKYRFLFGIRKMMAIVISVVVFAVALWLGVVLGLDGTMWN